MTYFSHILKIIFKSNLIFFLLTSEGVRVKGYFAWSLFDNFEWKNGYLVGFGLYHVNRSDGSLDRNPKLSAKWFADFLQKPQPKPNLN